MQELCGWKKDPDAVDKILSEIPRPLFGSANQLVMDPNKETFLWDYVRAVLKIDAPAGPQKIGDCVSWGWGNLTNYIACLQIFNQLKNANLIRVAHIGGELVPIIKADDEINPEDKAIRDQLIEEYNEAATEAIYALSRCEIGKQFGSYSDGSVGAWAAKAVATMGTLGRKLLGPYDPKRAKEWGAKGLPDNLEPEAKQHLIKTVSLVKTFEEAVTAIQNGYPVAVCSDQGFTMRRDSQGFCSASGTWYHCMLFVGQRWDRPGLCCSQSWGKNTPDGPLVKGQPDNTFWVDAKIADRMLRQNDSFTGSQFQGYPAQNLLDWKH